MLAMLGFAREGTETAPPPDRRRSSVTFQTPREATTRHDGDGRGSMREGSTRNTREGSTRDMGEGDRDLTRIDWRRFAEDPGATHGGEEPKTRFWQRRPAWMQKKDPCGLEEWNPRARRCVEFNRGRHRADVAS